MGSQESDTTEPLSLTALGLELLVHVIHPNLTIRKLT